MNALDVLLQQQPAFHATSSSQRTSNWGLHPDVLRWLDRMIPRDAVTLETGSGYSTVVFLSHSSRHIVVAPDAGERDVIEAFCNDNGLESTALEFVAAPSQSTLPTMMLPELDMVLIDGSHSFPIPFLDWYYTADALRQGGLVLVDDTDVRTGRVLRAFLSDEPEWSLVEDLGRTAVFRKLVDGPVRDKVHMDQPWGAVMYAAPGASPAARLAILRHRVRLRTRIRSWANRGRSTAVR